VDKLEVNIPNTNIKFTFLDLGDFEYANPFDVFFNARYNVLMTFGKKILKQQKHSFTDKEINAFMLKKAFLESEQENRELLNLKIPDGLLRVLELDRKKEQLKSLKKISINQKEFQAFILRAYVDYGYTYSLYRAEFHHQGLDNNDIPTLAFKDNDGKILSTGDTKLTDGELKHAINYRKMTISKFFDNGDKWHCFFLTFKSLAGKELTYNDGQSHMHYISYTFGKSRHEVLGQLKSEKYNLGSLPHIDYFTHRNDKK